MKGVIHKWGSGAAVRIPAAVLRAGPLKIGSAVDIREEDGRIVIEPAGKKALSLDELLGGITPENQHPAVDFGRPVGKEVW